MPSNSLGQMITFATEVDPDEQYTKFIWIRVTQKDDTIQHIAAVRGHRELAHEIAQLNGIRSVQQKLKKGRLLKIPGTLEKKLEFDVHAQDGKRPMIKDGYAKFDVFDRYGEKGITHFKGYNPLAMDVPILFEGWRIPGAGNVIMDHIRILERMAGRGPGFKGAASGPPAIIRVSVTDNNGNVVPLISNSWQWNPPDRPGTGTLWRINGIDWDEDALSSDAGHIVRQTATVHLWEFTPVNIAPKATQRHKTKKKTTTKKHKKKK